MYPLNRRDILKTTLAASTAALTSSAFAADDPLRILFFGGDLPKVEEALKAKFAVDILKAGTVPNQKEDNVQGLEQLEKADLWIGSIAKRTFPNEKQLKHFQDYVAAGKPIVGYRAASHVFQNWLEIDRKVFGVNYGVHHLHGKEQELKVELAEGAAEHPILKGLTPPPPVSGSYIYKDLEPDVTLLLSSGLPGDMMPHTWARTIKATGNRVFYTRYDADDFARNEVCRELFLRGIAWSLGGKLTEQKR